MTSELFPGLREVAKRQSESVCARSHFTTIVSCQSCPCVKSTRIRVVIRHSFERSLAVSEPQIRPRSATIAGTTPHRIRTCTQKKPFTGFFSSVWRAVAFLRIFSLSKCPDAQLWVLMPISRLRIPCLCLSTWGSFALILAGRGRRHMHRWRDTNNHGSVPAQCWFPKCTIC